MDDVIQSPDDRDAVVRAMQLQEPRCKTKVSLLVDFFVFFIFLFFGFFGFLVSWFLGFLISWLHERQEQSVSSALCFSPPLFFSAR